MEKDGAVSSLAASLRKKMPLSFCNGWPVSQLDEHSQHITDNRSLRPTQLHSSYQG